jgi:predicted DNA binding CopG/RHH family protein
MAESRKVAEGSEADLQELAEYFDRTDAGDLPWEEATDVVIERRELEQISLRLPKDDLAALKRRAARAGVGYTTLIRLIVRQYLNRGRGGNSDQDVPGGGASARPSS